MEMSVVVEREDELEEEEFRAPERADPDEFEAPEVEAEENAEPAEDAPVSAAGGEDSVSRAGEAPDLVALYLREVGSIPLLTSREEVQLARQWRRARQAEARLRRGTSAHPKRRRQLQKIIGEGRQAREHLIKANSRLVISMARKYLGRGVPLGDLIQEGNLGLMRAVDRYDPELGFRFSTYAIWWIRQAIARSIADQGRTIRLPAHMVEDLSRLDRISRELAQRLGRDPTSEELAAEAGLPPQRVAEILQMAGEPVSLDTPVGEEESSTLADFVVDEETPTPNHVASRSLLGEQVEEALAGLTPREAQVLRLRFGLEDGRSYTLEEVGERLGLTRERIRQIQTQALRRLRHPRRSRYLKGYLNN